ncbi:MAG: NAD(P)-dependent oxidoreductase, partial [Pseudomonadota bacterium]
RRGNRAPTGRGARLTKRPMAKAAVTGGTGFVGAALIGCLLDRGWSVSALARDPDRLPYKEQVEAVPGALEDDTALTRLADGADIFFHLAGVTHARRADDYMRANVVGAKNAATAAAAAGARMVHASSLSARKPEVSPYAASKRQSETAVAEAGGDWLALRLPAIYGPRDMATLPFFKLVKAGFALAPKTATPARASIIFVSDVAAALLAAADVPGGRVYEVGDDQPEGHSWRQIGEILAGVLGRPARAIAVPRPVIATYHGVVRMTEGALGRTPSVREGQINEFFHPDWVARDNLFSDAAIWRPETPLQEGFAKTARWYQEHDLL